MCHHFFSALEKIRRGVSLAGKTQNALCCPSSQGDSSCTLGANQQAPGRQEWMPLRWLREAVQRELKTLKLVLGKLLVFRSDLHIYTLSTRTLNPKLQWDWSVVCYCSSISVQFPAVNAAPSLVSIPDKSCQLSFPRSLCCLKIPPTSVFAKLVNTELSLRSCGAK